MQNIALIINSCKGFYSTTVPKLIESCKAAKIPASSIYVVVGECDEETSIMKKDEYNLIFCRYVNIDYNGILYFLSEVGISELKKYSHFFYIHDTCLVEKHFWREICMHAENCPRYIKLEAVGSKNIGLLNVDWFIREKRELFRYYINYNKDLRMQYKSAEFPNRDAIYNRFNNLPRWLNEDCIFICEPPHFTPVGDVFINEKHQYMTKIYSNEERLATLYKNIGLIKFQKNWGDPNWKLTL